ncbi:TonB-dependent receptor [Sphingomonas sp. MA1305]|uniref:TonB-dependent receptor domain-containing protein n=1 Tax=Sphingomonas sp. MA1305 TaxID=2479204 RepID=UPI0018DF3003|nr:TonB-dependent receptor [Sphingomonas sp. MA1305]MBI0476785.1 TonB-dependent receptor [Sphingomonas sp. MA1305]
MTRLTRLAGATALASTLFLGTMASAQTAGQTSNPPVPADSTTSANAAIDESQATTPATSGTDTQDENQEILITGSRIRVRSTIDAAVPIATITGAELLGTRGDLNVGDALNTLPQFRPTFSQANSTGSIGTAGLSLLDVRGLGTSRTLVLVNGRRVVTAVPGSYTPDISTIPSDLIENVESVTGGNSAIYGSDAVAGVVNFKLRRNYQGLRLRAQSGVSEYGDRGSYLVSGIAGHNFADGKLNVTVSGEYSRQRPVFYSDRSYLGATTGVPGFITSQITTAPNRNFDGIPNTAFVGTPPGITYSNLSLGGVVQTSCPAATATNATRRNLVCTGQTTPTGGLLNYFYNFLPNGTLIRNDPSQGLVDNRSIGGGVLGGLGATGVEDAMLLPGQERVLGNLFINAELSRAFQPFLEATYAHVNAQQQSTQPTFINATLSPTFSLNNAFLTTQARNTLTQILAPGATSFTLYRFNNDFGTRAEQHSRDTYRAVLGVRGDLNSSGSLNYEIAGNYGRTENFYATGGNVRIANYNNAVNAVLAPANYAGSNYVLNSAGQRVVCGINADASTTNDDAGCFPLNVFGYGAPSQQALNYILYRSTRRQWAEEIDATAYISGDTSGFLRLPGGPIGFSLGGEYRREDAYSAYDALTSSCPAQTFLNCSAPFNPPAVNIKEAFGELRVPLLANLPLIKEFTLEGAGRVSDYGGTTGSVWAWNAGAIWAPVRGLRFRATLSRSVRAPNLSNLYATQAVTFANGLTDPCDQPGGTNSSNNITANPNRARNCAAAGIPTTITFANPANPAEIITRPWTNQASSGVAGYNQGNPNLTPEVGNSFTLGGILAPEALPGFTLKVDYYNIRVKNVISGLTGQAILNRCYDDPGGINNQFCAAIFRRTTNDPTTNLTFNGQTSRTIDTYIIPPFPLVGNGIGFINQPYNFAQLKTRGIDFDAAYSHRFSENFGINVHGIVSYLMDRLSYSYITEPNRYDRIDSTLGDPRWRGNLSVLLSLKNVDLNYVANYVGKQIVSGLSYETFFASQGRPALNPDARPFVYYDPIVYQNVRIGVNANDRYRFYFGVDNVTNELPPYDATGTGNDAIYPNTGRFFYAGVEVKF